MLEVTTNTIGWRACAIFNRGGVQNGLAQQYDPRPDRRLARCRDPRSSDRVDDRTLKVKCRAEELEGRASKATEPLGIGIRYAATSPSGQQASVRDNQMAALNKLIRLGTTVGYRPMLPTRNVYG